MKPVRFHPEADSEMAAAARWYESQQDGLGKRFLTSIQESLTRIELDPEIYPIVEGDVRRCLVKIFPYGVLFRFKGGVVSVMAVMHLHREPGYWKNRASEQQT